MTSADVLVLGGGPAGSAAARTLACLGKSVVVVERSTYHDWRPGESLPPQARTTLAELGVVERLLELEPATSFGIRACWGQSDPYAIDFILDASGTGCQVERPRFDAMLASAAADAGAALVTGARLFALEVEGCCWHAGVETAGQRRVFRARALVDATGRSAVVARRLGVRRRSFDRLIGLVGLVDRPESAAVDSNLLLEAVEDGWWYSAPLPRSRMTVAFMTDADLISSRACASASAFTARLRQAPYTTERVQEFRLRDLRVRSAATARLDEPSGAGWLAVGDAAEAHDPLAGIGLTKAIDSGRRGARALAAALDGDAEAKTRYAADTAASFRRYLRQRAEQYARERRWATSPFWRRRRTDDALLEC
ncbi:MAG: FAD-dependent monooxygenase [Gaiellaceae bacterium]